MQSQTFWWKRVWRNVREFVWPMLEGEASQNQAISVDPVVSLSDDCLEDAFKLQNKLFDAEDDRRKGIESKAALFIGTISVTSSVVVATSALLISNNAYSVQIRISVLLSCILSIYTVTTVWYSVKSLERRAYANLDFDDITVGSNKNEYFKKLIIALEKAIRINQDSTNDKMSYLTLAQLFYKRAIVVISIYTFMILLICFFSGSKVPIPPATPVIAPVMTMPAPKAARADSSKSAVSLADTSKSGLDTASTSRKPKTQLHP